MYHTQLMKRVKRVKSLERRKDHIKEKKRLRSLLKHLTQSHLTQSLHTVMWWAKIVVILTKINRLL